MACLQPQCLSSINPKLSTPKTIFFPRTHFLKPFKISSFADSSPYPTQSLSTSGQNPAGTAAIGDGEEGAKKIPDAVRAAMEKAREYKRNKGLGEVQVISEVVQNPVELANEDDSKETEKIPDRVRIAMEKAREYKRNKGLAGGRGAKIGEGQVIYEVGRNQTESANGDVGAVMITSERPSGYKKNKGLVGVVVEDQVGQSPNEPSDKNEESPKIPDRVRIAMEKAREYKKNKGLVKEVRANGDFGRRDWMIPVEVGIGMERAREHMKKKGLVENADNEVITGLNRGSISEAFPDDYYPEVEIIVGDASKFGNQTSVGKIEEEEERGAGRLTPKLSRWRTE